MAPLYGKISDIYGRRPTIYTAILIFLAGSLVSALAPTNTLVGNPAALKKAIDTGGGSAVFVFNTGEELVEYRADKFLEVAERAMARRDVTLSEAQRNQLLRAWRRARGSEETE